LIKASVQEFRIHWIPFLCFFCWSQDKGDKNWKVTIYTRLYNTMLVWLSI